MVKDKGGRPSKLSKIVSSMIFDGVAQGLTYKAACKGAGVSYSSLAGWMAKGRKALKDGVENEFSALAQSLKAKSDELRWKNYRESFPNFFGRDYRRGWKNPMKDSVKQKLREIALEKVVRRVLNEQNLL